MNFLVLNVRPYSFEADDGRQISGASVTYLDLEAGDDTTPSTDEKGLAPLTISAPERIVQDFDGVPGLYQLHFTHRRGKGGKPQLSLGGATLVRTVDLSSL